MRKDPAAPQVRNAPPPAARCARAAPPAPCSTAHSPSPPPAPLPAAAGSRRTTRTPARAPPRRASAPGRALHPGKLPASFPLRGSSIARSFPSRTRDRRHQPLSRPRQPRHHRPDGGVDHARDLLVRHPLQLAQHQHLAIIRRQRVQSLPHRFPVRVAQLHLFRIRGAVRDPVQVFARMAELRVAPLLPEPVVAGVAHDGEQPRPPVLAVEPIEERQRAQTRLLHHVVGILRAPRKPPREIISRIQVRQQRPLEAGQFRGIPDLRHMTAFTLPIPPPPPPYSRKSENRDRTLYSQFFPPPGWRYNPRRCSDTPPAFSCSSVPARSPRALLYPSKLPTLNPTSPATCA